MAFKRLRFLNTESISVMITDLRMPQMDGLELINKLRAEGNLPPTLVLTAYGSMDLAVNTVHELGVFWFLEKPVDAQSLRLLVDRAAAHGRLQSEVHELRRELTMHGALGKWWVNPKACVTFSPRCDRWRPPRRLF